MVERSEPAESGRLFGPFRDRYFVETLLRVIGRIFGFRACTEPVPVRMSLNYEIGRCSGPCRGKISALAYARVVERVISFLNGEEAYAVGSLEGRMAACVASREFELAGELRDALEFCRNFCSRQRFFRRFQTEKFTLGDAGWVYEFSNGTLFRVEANGREVAFRHLFPACDDLAAEDPRFVIDRANIVYAWVHRRRDGGRSIVLPQG